MKDGAHPKHLHGSMEWNGSTHIRIKQAIGSGTCIIDLGCGSGHLLNARAERFDQRIGLDVSRTRLDTLAGDETDGWAFREADLNGLFPLADASADAV